MSMFEDFSDMILPIKTYDDAPDDEQAVDEPHTIPQKGEVTNDP